jgi:hypothetical protein
MVGTSRIYSAAAEFRGSGVISSVISSLGYGLTVLENGHHGGLVVTSHV